MLGLSYFEGWQKYQRHAVRVIRTVFGNPGGAMGQGEGQGMQRRLQWIHYSPYLHLRLSQSIIFLGKEVVKQEVSAGSLRENRVAEHFAPFSRGITLTDQRRREEP